MTFVISVKYFACKKVNPRLKYDAKTYICGSSEECNLSCFLNRQQRCDFLSS